MSYPPTLEHRARLRFHPQRAIPTIAPRVGTDAKGDEALERCKHPDGHEAECEDA